MKRSLTGPAIKKLTTVASFSAIIKIIGVNPYVLLPQNVLKVIFKQAGKDKSPIPVKGKINGHPYQQNLVRYNGKWRLYLNTPMRKAAGIDVGDTGNFEIEYDPLPRAITIHPKLETALLKNKKIKTVFDSLTPSRQKEIIRYINFLKTEESVDRNITKVIGFLSGNDRFVGRDKP
ncbi:MAG: DUF1905 domain-containing protein [Bacteroidetes bacterium]|nr:MAG: DUF1905 domain-containing protein [Bacteroidota bacterium]